MLCRFNFSPESPVCVPQEKSHIEVYWRPLVKSASALVFLSRRSDMPFLYHTSLAKLHYNHGIYEVCVSEFCLNSLSLSTLASRSLARVNKWLFFVANVNTDIFILLI